MRECGRGVSGRRSGVRGRGSGVVTGRGARGCSRGVNV